MSCVSSCFKLAWGLKNEFYYFQFYAWATVSTTQTETRQNVDELLHLPGNSFLNGHWLFTSPFLRVQVEITLRNLRLSAQDQWHIWNLSLKLLSCLVWKLITANLIVHLVRTWCWDPWCQRAPFSSLDQQHISLICQQEKQWELCLGLHSPAEDQVSSGKICTSKLKRAHDK